MSVTSGERRVVSALIADVVGSTAIAERLGPERSKFFFDEIVRLMREEVERFGGTVAQLTGDGLLALFGAPTAHEDDSARAVRAALALHESLARYGAEVAAAYGIDLAARVAVNTGPVVVPDRDLPPEALYNALGDTVNVAARLQALGELVVGPTTAHQIEDIFELEALGGVELKGRQERVLAFRVVGVRDEARVRFGTPFVGRTDELVALHEVFVGLVAGRGAIVSITGEPGIGKSRLVAEMSERFSASVRFLTGHAASYTDTIPYWPVRELLRAWLGLGGSDSEARVRLELRAALARDLRDEADDAYPFLASLLGLALEPSQEQQLRDFAGDAIQRQTFDWLYRLVSALSTQGPLCLVMEDLQWSDEATLAMLEELLVAAEHAPVAFLLIHRNDPDHRAWQLIDRARRRFRRLFVDVDLEPLADVEVRALAEANAGVELPKEFAQLLADRVGGNPYFVGEAIRDLRERNVLTPMDVRDALAAETSFPAALQGVLQARLDRLHVDAREVVSTAAVIGRSFSLPLLERLLPRVRLLPILSDLEWLQLVVGERMLPAPEYRFRHGLVQEVAYRALVEARRRELHLRVGEAVLELHRDSPAGVYGLLAHHFAEADEPNHAIEFLLKAGDAARAIYAQDEALRLYRRALGFMERTEDDGRARQTLLKMALTHHLSFEYRAANEAFSQASARAAPATVRLEPTEWITWAVSEGWGGEVAPGRDYSSTGQVARSLFRGLVAMGRDSDIEPDLAERLSVSDDGLVYRFTLRADAHWSDGVPVTAGDFEFTFAKMVEEGVATAFLLDGVTARAVDQRTVEIRLRAARNDFLYALSLPVFFPWPRHVVERDGIDWHRNVPLVGNGPFVLTERDSGRLVMAAAPTWHGPRGNVGAVTVEMVSAEIAADRWRRGDFDGLEDINSVRTVADDQTSVQRSPGTMTWYLGFDAGHAPFDDPRMRLAAAHAVDRRGPAELVRGTAAGTGGLIPPTIPGHSHRVAPAFDLDRARALLGEAGHPGGGGLAEIVVADLDLWGDVTANVAAQLAVIGFRAQVLTFAADFEAAIKDGATHAYVWAFGADYPDTGRGFLDPAYRQLRLYRDEQLEELLVRAASVRDQDERLRTYREFERIWIGEQAALVPLAYADSLLWTRPWITGMWVNPTQTSTFAEAVVKRTPTA